MMCYLVTMHKAYKYIEIYAYMHSLAPRYF